MNTSSDMRPLTLSYFIQAAEAHPEASRFILKKEGSTTSIVPHMGSFYGKSMRTLTSTESTKNREILEAFKAAVREAMQNTDIHWSLPNEEEQKLLKNGFGAFAITRILETIPQLTTALPVPTPPIAIPLGPDEMYAQDILLAQDQLSREAPGSRIDNRQLTWAQSTLKRKTPLKEIFEDKSFSPALMATTVSVNEESIVQKTTPIVPGHRLLNQNLLGPVHSARKLTPTELAQERIAQQREEAILKNRYLAKLQSIEAEEKRQEERRRNITVSPRIQNNSTPFHEPEAPSKNNFTWNVFHWFFRNTSPSNETSPSSEKPSSISSWRNSIRTWFSSLFGNH